MIGDVEVVQFTNCDEMIGYVANIEDTSKWIENVSIEDVVFTAFSSVMMMASDASEADRDTVACGTKLFMQSDKMEEPVGIRQCGLQSIYRRLDADCGYVSRLSPVTRAERLTEAAMTVNHTPTYNDGESHRSRVGQKKAQIEIVDGKVSAFLSNGDTKNDYAKHTSSDLMTEARDAIEKICNVTGYTGFFTYTGIDCTWETDQRIEIDNINYTVEYHLSSSDVGLGAVVLTARFKDSSGSLIPMKDTEKVLHRQKSTSSDVEIALDALIKKEIATKKDMEALKNTVVQYPEECLMRVANKCGLQKKACAMAVHNYIGMFGNGCANALSLYRVLCKVNGELAKTIPTKFQYRNRSERNVLKALAQDSNGNTMWSQNDYPKMASENF